MIFNTSVLFQYTFYFYKGINNVFDYWAKPQQFIPFVIQPLRHTAMIFNTSVLFQYTFYFYKGINNVFDYSAKPQQFIPFVIKNQPNPKRMCHVIDERKDMDLEFTFAKCKKKISSSRLIWRYTIMCETEDKTGLETAHGYFRLHTEGITILNLKDSYDLKRVKWLYFVAIDPVNPMRRAWFNAIKGPAFGMPEIVQKPEEEPSISTTQVDGKTKYFFRSHMQYEVVHQLVYGVDPRTLFLVRGSTHQRRKTFPPHLKSVSGFK